MQLSRIIVVITVALSLMALAGKAEARRYASIVIDARTGQLLHADGADRWVYPASLTKMMTLYMAFEALDRGRLTPGQQLRVSARAASMPPSELGLRAGERIRVRDAMLALVTKSANDAAVVLAEAMGETEPKFARLMTARAADIGLRATTFRNASGLPDVQQRTTARDMARLALRLQRDFPHHYAAFATTRFTYAGTTYRNHNRLLESYHGTDGIKTGYIRASGFNLAASVERDGRRLIGVVFGGRTSKSRNAHMVELLDAAFRKATEVAALTTIEPSPRRSAEAAIRVAAAPRPAPTREYNPLRRPPAEPTRLAAVAPDARPDDEPAGPLRVLIRPANASSIVLADHQGAGETMYGVDIGAFGSASDAHRAAAAVTAVAPPILADAAVEVSSIVGDDGTVYRARRMGIAADAAVAICRALGSAGQNCQVVRRSGIETQVVDMDAS